MKKRIFAIIALGAALCSCSKEELTPADKIEYTLDIDCCFEDDTKALKSEFVENDYVYFIFDKLSGYLRLKKTATGWSYALGNNLTLQAIGENTSKRYRAFWVDGNTIG